MSRRVKGILRAGWMDQLEPRIQLTGNIVMTSGLTVDSNDNTLTTITEGQKIYIAAHFTTQGLPSGSSYRILFDVDGLIRHTTTTDGAGGSGKGSWIIWHGTFDAALGTNQVTITVDPDQSVAETSYTDNVETFTFTAVAPATSYLTYSGSQLRAAYGIDSIPDFGSAAADGTGQTIAIIDRYNDPTILTDLDGYDQQMNVSSNSSPTLYDQYGPASSILRVYNDAGTDITANIANSGTNGVPIVDSTGGWELEETLDVESAHAIAPGAHIDLIETSASGNLDTAAAVGAALPGVSVVSMSFIGGEGSGELNTDSKDFVTPAGHSGVTFLASAGDAGTPGGYPAMSSNVVAVGGTNLIVNNGGYGSETAWSYKTPRTLNNGSSSYSQTGSWTGQSGGFSGTYDSAAGGSSSSATWTTAIASSDQGWGSGTEVSATWLANAANATNATYSIYDGTSSSGKLLGTASVDQTIAPVGTSDGSTFFQELGVYHPTSGNLTVILDAGSANGDVVADAVGILAAWATGGGKSKFEPEPAYQLPFQSTGSRTIPDVSFDGASESGITLYQNGGIGFDYYGTSLSCPCWAALFAIANQGRVAAGGTVFNSTSNPIQALQAIYSLPSSDFHDITTGYNGLFPTAGYDDVTGRGTPIANVLIPDLVNYALPPAVVASTFSDNTAPDVLLLTFNVDVSGSLSASDLVLQNLTTGQTVPSSSIFMSYNANQNKATFDFLGYLMGILPDGNYRATLSAGSVKNSSGSSMASDFTLDFFVLTADANQDRTVNALDFNALATNYGKAGTFGQGDFDYSGTVDSNDFALLASRYGTVLAAATGSAMPASSARVMVRATSLGVQPVGNLFADQPISAVNDVLK